MNYFLKKETTYNRFGALLETILLKLSFNWYTPNHSNTGQLAEEVGRRVAFHKEGSFIYIHSDHSYTMTHNFCVHLKKKNNYRFLLFINCKRWVKMCNYIKRNLSTHYLYESVMNWLILPYRWAASSWQALMSFLCFASHSTWNTFQCAASLSWF